MSVWDYLDQLWAASMQAKSVLIPLAVVWVLLAGWVVWTCWRARREMRRVERAWDVVRRSEARESVAATSLRAFREFPSECPWEPEGERVEFHAGRRAA